MQDINNVTIVGRLTRDAEIKQLPSGTEIAEMSIASNWSRKVGDEFKEEVSYFDVTKFKPGGLAKYLVKGKQIAVSGELQQQRWEHEGNKRSRVKIIAQKLQLLGGKSEGGASSGSEAYGSQPGDFGYTENSNGSDFEDEGSIPF